MAGNLAFAHRLFRVEYTGHQESNEGQFIAITRQVAARPADLLWWPEWACGLPFQHTYLPLLPLIAASYSRLTGHSPALSYHQVVAAAFCLGPVFLYFLAWVLSGSPPVAFLASCFYAVVSPCVWLFPSIRSDVGGPWNLRRLNIVGYYGEGPHTLSMAFVPLAILFVYFALTRPAFWRKVLAGVFLAAAVLSNAFAAVILIVAATSLLAVYGANRVWRRLATLGGIAFLTYFWISPLLPPSVIAAIRANSPTVSGDYRFTHQSWIGMAVLAFGFAAVWLAGRRMKWPAHVRFASLFSWLITGIVVLGVTFQVYVVPQPHRYQIAMDMSLCLVVVFAAAELLRRTPRRLSVFIALLALAACLLAGRNDARYAHRIIRSADPVQPRRIAGWAETNLHGVRIFVGGAATFSFNDFTDTPQLHGGQDPMLPNSVMNIAVFTIYVGTNGGPRDSEIAVLWLKAMGARAISVAGPESEDPVKPFANPRKFDGVLPLLWESHGDRIYGVPARDQSLAHVMDVSAIIHRRPIDGLDTFEIERYDRAMDSPEYSQAIWQWTSRHTAVIHAVLAPGQVVATQITYHPGWHATLQGLPQPIQADGLGLLVVKPACQGACDLTLWFDGGTELRAALWASGAAMMLVAVLGVICLRRRAARDF
jgi:hypothetical protein